MSDFYMSFADADLPEGSQFLGACIISAPDLRAAVTKSHVLGINPGGEIQIVEIPEDSPPLPARFRNKLLDRSEIEEMDRVMLGDASAKENGDQELRDG